MERTITQKLKVGGVLVNATSAKLSDPTGAFGIRRNDTLAVVVADGTNMTNTATGEYEYTFTALAGISYTAYIEFVYDGDTIRVEFDVPAVSDAATGMVASYDSLLDRVGHELFGIRSGFSADQTVDILQCIKDGLHYVYTAHDWSFFRPIADITTTAPYATGTVTIVAGVVTLAGGTFPSWAADGILKVSDDYHAVSLRNSGTSLTLDDTSVAAAALTTFQLARPEVPLPDGFEAIANDSALAYYPGQNEFYPPVRQGYDVRSRQQDNPYFDRPWSYSISTVEFDPTVGSRKQLVFYPTPDAAYVLRVPMILRPTMIDSTHQYPVGGETLAQLIVQACLMSVELDFYEKVDGRHTRRFYEMLPLAIRADLDKSTPTSLGGDAPRGEGYYSGLYDYDYARAARIGTLTLDGTTL